MTGTNDVETTTTTTDADGVETTTTTVTPTAVEEAGQVADAADATNPGADPASSSEPIKLWSLTKTGDTPRGSTNVDASFNLDLDSGLAGGDLVTVDLPCAWGAGFSASTTATLKSVDAAGVETEVASTVTTEGGGSLKIALTSPAVLAVATNYTLEVKNVATP